MQEYTWLTYVAGRQQLAARLADTKNQFWADAENGLYLCEALRVWNALTFTWKTPYAFSIAAATAPTWLSLGTLASSPRLRTLTDTALYTLMEYHLLEPATGGTWTGTTQFAMTDLSLALQRCRDEAIQASNCNHANPTPIAATPGGTTALLPDNVLDVARAQWVPATGTPTTLMRNDETGFNLYQAGYLQTPPGTPAQYNIATQPPLTLQVDVAPNGEGAYDLIALMAGAAFAPPTASLLNVPDDLAWVLKWGALADLLGRESEATDLLRAAWCKQRYIDGVKLMQHTPWVMEAQINGVSADFVDLAAQDIYEPEWDSAAADLQTVVVAGMDFFTVVPLVNVPIGMSLTVLGNAPVPVLDTDYIQVSRDAWDAVLDYAQFLACFKQVGAEFKAALALEQNFMAAAKLTNGRLSELGLFANLYTTEGQRQTETQPRFATV
jgi:hypothetical protein